MATLLPSDVGVVFISPDGRVQRGCRLVASGIAG